MKTIRFIIRPKRHISKSAKVVFIAIFFILSAIELTQGQGKVIDCQEITSERFQELDNNQRIRCGGEVLNVGDFRRQVTEATDRVTEFFKKTEKASTKRLTDLRQKHSPPQRKNDLDKLISSVKTKTRNTNKGRKDEKSSFDRGKTALTKPQIIVIGSPFGVFHEGDDPAIVEHSDEIYIGVLHAGKPGKVWIGGGDTRSEVEVEKWADDSWKVIHARIPHVSQLPIAYGGPSFKFDLWVERADGVESNKWPMEWATDVKTVPWNLIAVNDCGIANKNICNNEEFDGPWCFFSPSQPPLNWHGDIVGQHFNCSGATGNNEGSDSYVVTTPPNWFLETFDTFTFHTNSDEASATLRSTTPLSRGTTRWEPIVDWWVTPNDWAAYKIIVYMRGAKGF